MTSYAPSLRLAALAELELRRRHRGDAIVLPDPHAKQRLIEDSPAKRKVICSGRRFGKTFLGARIAVRAVLDGRKVLIASTSQDQSDIFWSYAKEWLSPLLLRKEAYKNESRRIIEHNHGRLRVKTGSDADVLRGFDADVLILDECAYLEPDAWFKVGAPMLADRDGDAYFFSTPVRKNWFHVLYQRAVADTSGRWAAFHATTLDNPHLSAVAVAELAQDMTEEAYQQEILAQFLDGAGAVFRNVETCATAPRVEPYSGEFVMGVDTAQKADFTVAIVMDAHTRQMVDMIRFNQVPWAIYRERIRQLSDRWRVGRIIFETNSIGGPNFEALIEDGLPVMAFETTPASKPPLIQSLRLAFERSEIGIWDDAILRGELGAYEYKINAAGRPSYSAPEGLHDDCVMSLALAWHGIAGVGPLVF